MAHVRIQADRPALAGLAAGPEPAPLSAAVQPAILTAVQQVNKLDIAQRHEQTLAIFTPHKEELRPKHAQLFFTDVVRVGRGCA